jgi:SAM-dependent methyltransferase
MTRDRDLHKVTFDSVARRYHQARPDYPDALYDQLVELAGLTQGAELLEVGCGTGKATLPLASRGFTLTCVELGPELAAQTRRNARDYPAVTVVQSSFEAWEPPAPRRFDLIFAATSWHWIDPQVGYRKAWRLLRPGGHLAIWAAWHVFPVGGDPIFARLQTVYDEIGEALPAGFGYPTPETLADDAAEIEASGLFTDVSVRRFDWELRYNADEYIALLDTFSNHIAMEPAKRDRLYGAVRAELAARPDGQLRRHWGSVLHVARRADEDGAQRA